LPAIIEKDFWVVWTLKHLYELPDASLFNFKGGTSLSKAFGVIQRFSEDIDLIIDRAHFGYQGANDIGSASSGTAVRKRMEKLEGDIGHYIDVALLPALQNRFQGILTEPFRLEPNPDRAQTVFFYYPTELEHNYIRPMVLIETGGNADTWPTVDRRIRPYVAEQVPAAFALSDVVVKTIDASRTFWEKLTILHKTAHRFDSEPNWEPAVRYSRHYYDVYRLSQSGIVDAAMTDDGLLDAVRIAAQTFFADKRAKYEEFAAGSIRLIPNDRGIAALRTDYEAMRDMIFGARPTFDEIVAESRRLDTIVNRRTS
jgi:nucleotidyltransferase AbiEii toxin of type IV toxin-antitoxin system